ncbi:DUF1990 family protein [Bounagaea algeriensis]
MRHRAAFGLGVTSARRFLTRLRTRSVNYRPEEISTASWNVDVRRVQLGREHPGGPAPDGAWQAACRRVADYEFSPPELVRAAYAPDEDLLGRTMLLEGRFAVVRLYLGVRITAVLDERRHPEQRVWGFRYETLDGHLERGRLDYEVVKREDTGDVEFVMTSCSQRSPHLGPLLRLGWALFGRRLQLRFYRRCGQRMQELTREPLRQGSAAAARGTSTILVAPSDAREHRSDRMAVHIIDPDRTALPHEHDHE